MAVRNFWLDATIDGRKTELSGGPRSKEGGFELTIYMRDRGSIRRALNVSGWEHQGKLTLRISAPLETKIEIETER